MFHHRLLLIVLVAGMALDTIAIAGVLGSTWNRGTPAGAAFTSRRTSAAPETRPLGTSGTRSSWQRVGPPSLVHALVTDPLRSNVLYAATADGFLRSNDGGAHWRFFNTGLPLAGSEIWSVLPFDHAHLLAAAADDAHVYLSDDGGAHWRSERQVLGQGSVYALIADPTHSHALLAGGTGGIWRSLDGGTHWQQVFSNASSYVAAFAWPRGGSRLYAGVIPGPGQVLESADRGQSWRRVTKGFDGPEGIMALLSIRHTLLAGTMAHRVWRFAPIPATWRPSGAGLPAGSHSTVLLATADTKTIWSGTMGDGVYVSHDLGHTWKRFGSPLSGTAGIVLALAQHGGALLAGTATGIYRLSP